MAVFGLCMQASRLIVAAAPPAASGWVAAPHSRSRVSSTLAVGDWACRRWDRRIGIWSRNPLYVYIYARWGFDAEAR